MACVATFISSVANIARACLPLFFIFTIRVANIAIFISSVAYVAGTCLLLFFILISLGLGLSLIQSDAADER